MKTIEEITKQNPIYLAQIKLIKKLFYDLIYLYDNISRQDLVNNIQYLPFVKSINNIFENKYELFRKVLNKDIDEKFWNCIYGVWMLNFRINYSYHKEENIKIMKYVLGDLFDKYPIEDFITLLNIHQEYQLISVRCSK